jgi:hypothetical protein
MKEDIKCYCGHTTYCDCSPLEKPKQKTLEEVAERMYREYPTNPIDKPEWNYNRDINCFRKRKAFINGAKWQQERSYSEEDMLNFAEWCDDNYFRIGTTSFWAKSLFDEKAIAYKTEELLEIYRKTL